MTPASNLESTEAPFRKVSYSQCGEDMIINHIFQAIGKESPSYIDIGAHHPFYISNTAFFSQRGSRGINIEPDPSLFALFPECRPDDVNLNIGISDKVGELPFYIISAPTLNTFSEEVARSYEKEGNFKIVETKTISTLTIQDVIARYADNTFPDILSLDAEGIDEMILRAIDFERNAPTVICIETISFSESGHGVKNQDIINFLQQHEYLYYADTYINSIFVRKRDWLR